MAEERAAPRSGSSLTGSYLERGQVVEEEAGARRFTIPGGGGEEFETIAFFAQWNREFRKQRKRKKVVSTDCTLIFNQR